MIPKTIHYCWFGGKKKPKEVRRCIASWKKYCPGYKIVEWNEENFNVNICNYVKDAYNAGRWAFVSDYARCYVVDKHGGVYFDTDVELIRPIDDLLKYSAFFASEDGEYINTGIGFGSKACNKILEAILSDYDESSFYNKNGKVDLLTCPVRNTKIIKKFYPDLDFERAMVVDDTFFLSKDYFCPLDYKTKKMLITDNTYGIHWFSESWKKPAEKIRYKIRKILGRT